MSTLGEPRRKSHAKRTAESQAAFLIRHLRPGMKLLDLGSGPGSVTVGLAALVAPGETTGFDLHPGVPEGTAEGAVTLVTGDAHELPFEDGTFDAIFSSAMLQHVPDPLSVLREARRVAKPGAVIGLVDADWDGQLLWPTNSLLERSSEVMSELRAGTSPYVGKQLRSLLVRAGFVRCESYARVVHHGTPEEVAGVGTFTASLLARQEEKILSGGLATGDELTAMIQAWKDWSEEPGGFLARFWVEAVGWASEADS
ncbi:class I SAM-dependent methyltransferase [Kribbella sp. NPDC055071]